MRQGTNYAHLRDFLPRPSTLSHISQDYRYLALIMSALLPAKSPGPAVYTTALYLFFSPLALNKPIVPARSAAGPRRRVRPDRWEQPGQRRGVKLRRSAAFSAVICHS
ncbi:hypothetical protein SKAU_G00230530 [Synaphobranchus kaupii]|uniref:Uncharacterized protein n=1 Tax=Synaphobranchus kaupii TaxID=118154 RepID=A0A9Q1F5H7_SYNKA|nr:hypothetical protein SKAU_G00230530 [Synaphobranchus kaupii]